MAELLRFGYITAAAYYGLINLIAFYMFGRDKRLAREKSRRIPEKTLLCLGLAGGALGALLGMYIFRHKTRKVKFVLLQPLFLAVHLCAAALIFLS